MQSKMQAQLVISSKPMSALAFFIASILTHNQHANGADVCHAADGARDYYPTHNERIGWTFRRASSDVHCRLSAGLLQPVHRHNAQVFVYVLAGSVVMQVRGQEALTLGPGQSFYENPDDIHVVSRNASSTKPAQFLVFMIHKKGAPPVLPAR